MDIDREVYICMCVYIVQPFRVGTLFQREARRPKLICRDRSCIRYACFGLVYAVGGRFLFVEKKRFGLDRTKAYFRWIESVLASHGPYL
jgi:hypothetical protein